MTAAVRSLRPDDVSLSYTVAGSGRACCEHFDTVR
jgi:hypothetical protein